MRRSASGRGLVVAIAVTAALAVLTATAQAQEDPYATVEEQATTSDLDTDYTPVAKQSDLFTLVHGARFGETDVIEDSATRFDTELHDVAFRNTSIGLAVGSACSLEPIQQKGEDNATFGRRVAACEGTDREKVPRVPALYRYTVPQDADPLWQRLELPGEDDPETASGYIAAIAWIDADRALLVGGSGTYPRRELGAGEQDDFGRSNAIADPADPRKADEAGEARAWLYTRATATAKETVEELDLSALTADTPATGEDPARAGMRGLTAVSCFVDPNPTFGEKFLELCFAGALGQLWEWRDGIFTGDRVDARSPAAELEHGRLFRYRVRDIDFTENEPPVAVAVTSGCCDADEAKNTPRLLVYGPRSSGKPRWDARSFHESALCAGPCLPGDASPEASESAREIDDRPELPDSFYSLSTEGTGSSNYFYASVIASPGGPTGPGEPPSALADSGAQKVEGPYGSFGWTRPATELASSNYHWLGTARLLARDLYRFNDGYSVGELRSSARDGLGAQGLLVSSVPKQSATQAVNAGFSGSPPSVRPSPEELTGGWEPVDQQKLDAAIDSRHYLLPSYTANAIDVVGQAEDGWAVGDHGAILRLSASEAQRIAGASEPEPPRLGNPRAASLSDRGPYAEKRSELPRSAGTVPEFAGPETVELPEPQMIPSGYAGPTNQIVMSRDGSEGWAIGNDAGGPTFTHYDGVRWRRCDPVGIEGIARPDPACAELAPLRGWRDASGSLRTVSLTAAARVPLENDSDPTNDDELEIVAISGAKYRGPETGGKELSTMVRYRDGRWRLDSEGMAALSVIPNVSSSDLAFTAPDDGWLVARGAGVTDPAARFYHFEGESWIACAAEPARCGNASGRLPTKGLEVAGLTSAGHRVYVYGVRVVASSTVPGSVGGYFRKQAPMIVYRDPGGAWTDGSGADGGGFDPVFSDPTTQQEGRVEGLSVVKTPGGFEGWAVGGFGAANLGEALDTSGNGGVSPAPLSAALMRLTPTGWSRYRSPGALEDYMIPRSLSDVSLSRGELQVTYPSSHQADGVFIGQTSPTGAGFQSGGRIFGLHAERERFEMLDSGRPQKQQHPQIHGEAHPAGTIQAMAPDAQGGFWAAISGQMFHYTDQPPKPVFEEVANPFESRGVELRALTGGADGSVWAATSSDRLYRYERGLGWEEARVPGWDPGRVVTRASQARAIAVGENGEGVVVGAAGRIANLSPEAIALDPAAGRSCALEDPIPCGTSRDLNAAEIAPDGAAMAAGDRLSLLWRPPGGDFRAIEKPAIGSTANVVALSFPTPNRAYLATGRGTGQGMVFAGEMTAPGEWSWRVENWVVAGERLTSVDGDGDPLAIHDLAVDASGHGYAVGEKGLVMERSAQGGWRRLATRYPDYSLTAVELPETGGEGVLIGGAGGLVLAGSGSDVWLTRPADFSGAGSVLDFAYLPGSSEGSVDAWAGIAPHGDGDSRLLRYRAEPADPLLDGAAGRPALPDAPSHADGELAIGAFGKSECELDDNHVCPEFSGTTITNEVVSERLVDELAARRERGELDLAIHTGDANDSAGLPASSLADLEKTGDPGLALSETQRAGQLKHRRFAEAVVDELEEREVPLFGAIGGQDLSEAYACDTDASCETTKRFATAGENHAWREAFAGRLGPWGDGSGSLATDGELQLDASPGSEENSLRVEDQSADADGDGVVPETKASIGGASTHYAVDASRDGEPVARIVFVDTSLKSLAASDPLQQPHELAGGQLRFLERMICREGESAAFGDPCTRKQDQRAIVVSNTPTYSYGPGALTHTATDANVFEALMLKHKIDLVISGALGYNGLYYTLAPGVHEPCPAGEYPRTPPSGRTPNCLAGPVGPAEAATEKAPTEADPASLIAGQGFAGAYPTLIASGAGGKFGPDGNEPPDGPAGQWHGYSVARLLPNGELAIEQRPILDWIGLDAKDHAVSPRSRLALHGYGRSPISTTTATQQTRTFHYEISTPAITHRYDLLLADPDEPWLPCEKSDINCQELHANLTKPSGEAEPTPTATGEDNPCSPYLCLPSRIGIVDDQSGQVRAGDGKYPETFAIAMLSVDDKVATYPLVFKRSPSFVTKPQLRTPGAPPINPAPTPRPPSQPQPPEPPQIPEVKIPQIPVPPGIPQLTAAAPPEPQPPAPPAPPPPSQQPAPLDLSVAPPGVSISTPTALIQPPTPPVNPAPPGGARREARQRQAAAQKGGADSGEDKPEAMEGGGDMAEGRPGSSAMTRLDATRRERVRPAPSFTALAGQEQASTWSRGALYGGGLAFAALVLACSWLTLRPTPRRRRPELPAPAFGRQPWRRR